MRKNWLLVILVAFIVIAAGFGLAQKAPKPRNGTTLAAYKTIDICVVDPTPENPYGTTWRYYGEIAVWNEGEIWTSGFNIEDFIEYKPFSQQGPKWHPAYYVTNITEPEGFTGEIPPGTTQETALVFKYMVEGPALLDAYIRNNVKVTILNHSGWIGQPFGPNPKATYTGPLPPPPCEVVGPGCTLTQGYWATHSKYGPAPYDETWAQIGEDTPFFLSGTTWYGAITTEPKGNGYWILANQYIAAILNIKNGASVPNGVQTTLDQATEWFKVATPNGCSPSGCGMQKDWAAVLDDYNNGKYPGGPPHCDK